MFFYASKHCGLLATWGDDASIENGVPAAALAAGSQEGIVKMETSFITLPNTAVHSYNQVDTCKFCSAAKHGTRAWSRDRRALVDIVGKGLTPFGYRRPKRVRLDKQGAAALCFEFPQEDDPLPPGMDCEPAKSGKVLADFAYNGTVLMQGDGGVRQYQVDASRLRELAEHTGPVFGDDSRESAQGWGEAVATAQYAVQMQMALNGHAGFSELGEILFKTEGIPTDGGPGFRLCYCFAAANTPEYFDALAPLPQVRRLGSGLYSLATLMDVEDGCLLCVAALACDAELSAADFLVAVEMCVDELTEEELQQMSRCLEAAGFDMEQQSADVLGAHRGFIEEEPPITPDDRDLVETVRSTLVSLHVADVEVDMFRPAGEPLMEFPSYLSYLWYEFAVNTERVRVGFCRHCSRGFSLQGWRGRTKEFCPQCKDAGINARNRGKLQEARRLFVEEGLDVESIAAEVYPGRGRDEAVERVRHELATFPALKREVKASPDGNLARRCMRDGVVFAERKRRGSGGGAR